ncbi:hypothetical protein C8J56DRAFT_550508 [Mycena floridula]|nr:hypothetical protein C8J56DRAFT_550508 [Mycena floridula]
MPKLFNTIRLAIYGVLLLFAAICMAMAGRFASILAMTDLTRFVPGALFVCVANVLVILVLLAAGLLGSRNPVNTQMELGGMFVVGASFTILGIVLAVLDSKDADVECFSSTASTTVVDDSLASFHTEQYQAMYRVLNAFALMNGIIALTVCAIMLVLAKRRANNGDQHLWYGPITSFAWFHGYSVEKKRHARTPSSAKEAQTNKSLPIYTQHAKKPSHSHTRQPSRSHTKQTSRSYPGTRAKGLDRSGSGASTRHLVENDTVVRQIANGEMHNPNRR